MAEQPLVSVVIPVHNRSDLLRESVDSVICQDWRPLEIVIVNDGSTDETLAVAQAIVREHSGLVSVVTRPNGGPGAARQTGVEHSTGEFVQFLDSDDLLLPGELRVQVGALMLDPDAGIAYGRTLVEVEGKRRNTSENWSGESATALFPKVLLCRLWDTSNPLYRRSSLDEIGPWAPVRQLEDWEFECRAGSKGIRLAFVNKPLTVVRDCAPNRLGRIWTTNDEALKERLWVYRQVLNHSIAAGVSQDCVEFRSFIRSLFLMTRLAGTRGLSDEAERLFATVRTHATEHRLQLSLFAVMRALFGWRLAATLGERVRTIISK